MAAQGVQILRVHDVHATRQALLTFSHAGDQEGNAALRKLRAILRLHAPVLRREASADSC